MYDSSGNQIQENSSRFFEWDFGNQMRCFYNQAGTSEPTIYAQYLYDGAGNRVKKIVRTQGGDYESISYIGGTFEYKSNGIDEQTNVHIMDNNSRIAMIREGANFGDATPTVKYNLEDHLGSSTLLLETNGSLINKEEYYPFGETSFGSYAKKRYRFSGKEKDEESGLYYYGARYYMPWACKFISCDQMAAKLPQWSSYVSFNDNPIRFIDPDGMEGTDWIRLAGSNKWKWDPNVKAKSQNEFRSDGAELAKPGHQYSSYGTTVTLLDGGKWLQSPKIENKPEKVIDLTQNSQGWEPNPYGEQLKGMEVIPTFVIASSDADMWAINDWRFKQFCNSIDNMALGSFAIGFSPLIIAETLAAAPTLYTVLSTEGSYISSAIIQYKSQLITGAIGSTINFSGQMYTAGGDVSKVDKVGVITPLFTPWMPGGSYAQGVLSAGIDAEFDYSTEKGFKSGIPGTPQQYSKSGYTVANDFVWNAAGNLGGASFGNFQPKHFYFETIGTAVTGIPTNMINSTTNEQIENRK